MAIQPRYIDAQVIAPSAARTTTFTSQIFTNDPLLYTGMMFFLNITASSGTPNLVVKVQYVDPITGTAVVDVPSGAFAAKTGTGQDTLVIHPAVTASANRQVASPLTGYFLVVGTMTGGTPNMTYTIVGVPIR